MIEKIIIISNMSNLPFKIGDEITVLDSDQHCESWRTVRGGLSDYEIETYTKLKSGRVVCILGEPHGITFDIRQGDKGEVGSILSTYYRSIKQ